ncbi:Hsp20/alpha crystallin family protein [Candidatus Vondammii sp. HM_W22]|uniref:Hsp20 family protein n=1 Tax=Candidatus Vondammii sp. HM_W22 TaxID=2687299 RepID=UPI00240292EB|nr:Hsp20/alpha crystallin family protein [Candidatus Vondammii sp. HM_W22]
MMTPPISSVVIEFRQIDIKREEKRYVIHADIPGVEPEKIELFMENGMLTTKSEHRDETIRGEEKL